MLRDLEGTIRRLVELEVVGREQWDGLPVLRLLMESCEGFELRYIVGIGAIDGAHSVKRSP